VRIILYIAKIISFVFAWVFIFLGAAAADGSGDFIPVVVLALIGIVLLMAAYVLERLDQADWNEKTKYCTKNNRRVCGNRQRRKKEV